MLKEHVGSIDFKVKGSVLILILMEHAQRGDGQDWRTCHQRQDVLILILMEHAQRERPHRVTCFAEAVKS